MINTHTITNVRALLNRLSRNLGTLKAAISSENSANDLSLNTLMETRIMKVYNLNAGLNLRNANLFESNFPAVDGVDPDNRFMAQVTSTFYVEKIEHTVKKIIENKVHESYDRLTFIVLKNKKKLTKSVRTKIEN